MSITVECQGISATQYEALRADSDAFLAGKTVTYEPLWSWSLDKSWAASNAILARYAEQHALTYESPFFGGITLLSEEMFWCSAIAPAAVEQLATLLASVDEVIYRELYDPSWLAGAGTYPRIWQDEDALDYLLPYFVTWRQHVLEAAAQGQAMIVTLG